MRIASRLPLIGIMAYSFARVGAVIRMKVGDYFVQGRRHWVRLHEKGGKEHDVPCHGSCSSESLMAIAEAFDRDAKDLIKEAEELRRKSDLNQNRQKMWSSDCVR